MSLSATVARARSGLVQELVEVFNVVEVGGRPPIGGKSGTKGEWTIGDLILPVPGDIRRKYRRCPFLPETSKTAEFQIFGSPCLSHFNYIVLIIIRRCSRSLSAPLHTANIVVYHCYH